MALANGSDPRGRWLRERPFGVRVGQWFFSHAGNTGGRIVAALEATLRGAIALDANGALLRIDCGMSPGVDDSHGSLLRVRLDGGHEVAEALTPDGHVRVLWPLR